MSKYKKMAEIADLLISVALLVSFAAYFMFPHLALAKEISKSKNLEFDISKAFKADQISAVSQIKSGVLTAADSGKINYKPYAVIAETANIGEKTVSAGGVPEVVLANGIAVYVPASKDYKIIGKKQVYVTAYSSTPDQTDSTPFITASNTRVRDGIVAANFLPLGAKIKIPAIYPDKIFVVEDRMNIRYNQKVDIWFPTRQEAINFGIKWLDIEIVAEK